MHEAQEPILATATADATRAAAEALTRALDTGDLGTASRLLSPGCECEDGALRARGAEAVLAVYRAAASWAERGFDDVRHSSTVESTSCGHARALVTTVLMRVPGRWHRVLHVREISVDPSGRVVKIAHSCGATPSAAFRAFARECGAAPPPPGYGT